MNLNSVTIVTVCYNAANSILDTIQSVLSLSYPYIEYVVVDGGSTDGTKEIISQYLDKIDCYISESDKGIYDAMNKGIKLATGEWVLFLNSGDVFYQSNVLDLIFQEVVDNIDVIYGSTVIINPWGKYVVEPDHLRHINRRMPFCHQSVLVRRTSLQEYNFNLDFKVSADYDLFRHLYFGGKLFYRYYGVISIYDAINGFSTNNMNLMYREFSTSANEHSILTRILEYFNYFKLYILTIFPPEIRCVMYRFLFWFKKRYKRLY